MTPYSVKTNPPGICFFITRDRGHLQIDPRIGENGSSKPSGAPQTLQDPGEMPNTCFIDPDVCFRQTKENAIIILPNPFFGPYLGGVFLSSTVG